MNQKRPAPRRDREEQAFLADYDASQFPHPSGWSPHGAAPFSFSRVKQVLGTQWDPPPFPAAPPVCSPPVPADPPLAPSAPAPIPMTALCP